MHIQVPKWITHLQSSVFPAILPAHAATVDIQVSEHVPVSFTSSVPVREKKFQTLKVSALYLVLSLSIPKDIHESQSTNPKVIGENNNWQSNHQID